MFLISIVKAKIYNMWYFCLRMNLYVVLYNCQSYICEFCNRIMLGGKLVLEFRLKFLKYCLIISTRMMRKKHIWLNYIKFFKRLPIECLTRARKHAIMTICRMSDPFQSFNKKASESPAAGGCSESRMTIRKIDIPTAKAPNMMFVSNNTGFMLIM